MTDTTQTDAPALPALTPQDLALIMPEASTAEERIVQIESVRDTDIDTYNQEGLDKELLELRKEAGETDETYEGADDDGDDGSEDVVEPGDLSAEDLALIGPDVAEVDAAARSEVPETADAYELPQVDGFTWTAADEEAAAPFLESFHEQGVTQAAADAVLGTYAQRVAEIRQQVEVNDAASAKAAKAELARTWGGQEQARKNIETIKSFLGDETRVPSDVAEMIASARAPNGQRLINNPHVVDLLYRLASGQTSQTPRTAKPFSIADRGRASEQAPRAGYANERAEIMELMQTDIDAYHHRPWKGSNKTASERLLEIERQSGKRK